MFKVEVDGIVQHTPTFATTTWDAGPPRLAVLCDMIVLRLRLLSAVKHGLI